MDKNQETEIELVNRLRELGCEEKLIETLAKEVKSGNKDSVRLLLRRYRKELLDNLHECQNKVDSFDILFYQLNREKI